MFIQDELQYDDQTTAITQVVREVITEDDYGFRNLLLTQQQPDQIRTIIDIGANVGVFSLAARVLFPKARIIAIEPCADTYAVLSKNLSLFGVECHRGALGNGQTLYLQKQMNNSTINRFSSEPAEVESVPSYSLTDIFGSLAIQAPYCLKIDCEGGERWLPDNPGDGEILSHALHLSMEAHLALFHEKKEAWTKWFSGLFERTHSMQQSERWNGAVVQYKLTQKTSHRLTPEVIKEEVSLIPPQILPPAPNDVAKKF